MPQTAFKHFEEDMDRAWNLLQEARTLERAGRPSALHRDLRHAALAMAVGAMDAYLCDAYVDCLTSVLKAYTRGEWKGSLPGAYYKQPLPAGVVLDTSRQKRPRWALRMAARGDGAGQHAGSVTGTKTVQSNIADVAKTLGVDR